MKKTLVATVLLSMIMSATYLVQDSCAATETKGAAMQINLELTLADNLLAFKGKTVTVTLSSGQTMAGIVKNVNNGILHLEKLAQKEFFDAIIVIDKISAVEVRVK
ncbi:MAG: hypothetical protein KJ630_03645 [Proteobacteria bacterium]|nr:hypothetical protein [Pseudomonadota bacterium]